MPPAVSTTLDLSKHVEWMWESNSNSLSQSEPVQWNHYSDIENLIIEEAFLNNEPRVTFDHYYIDIISKVQVSNDDDNDRKCIKRVELKKEGKRLRKERFIDAPAISKNSPGGEYGWVSPFIIEVRRYLELGKDELPSKNKNLIPTLVTKAADGIIAEGTQIGKRIEAEKMAELLRKQKDAEYIEVWKCCAHLYSLGSFLYKNLNEAMRWIGTKASGQDWQNKVYTLGPFCLLLWDDPIKQRMTTKTKLYRGVQLEPEEIAIYENLAKDPYEYRSFQAFTSCSHDRAVADVYGNTLFIIEVLFAFTSNIGLLSQFQDEEEEVVTPGACFSVQDIQFDSTTDKHLITLELRQRWSRKSREDLKTSTVTKTNLQQDSEHDRARRADLGIVLPLLDDDQLDAINASGSDYYLGGNDDDAACARLFLDILDATDDDVDTRAGRFDRDGKLVDKEQIFGEGESN